MAAPLTLTVEPLTRAAFREFGDVIETDGADSFPINEGTTTRYHDLASVDVASQGGVPLISIFRGLARPAPIEIRMMEHHPLGTQAFYPLQNHAYLVVVAPCGEAVGPEDLRAFRAAGDQGVNYHRGVWHHPLLVLRDDHDFLVVDRGGDGDNCVEHHFGAEQGIALLDV